MSKDMTTQPQERDIDDLLKHLRERSAVLSWDGVMSYTAGLLHDAALAIDRLRAQPSPREEHGWVIEGAWSDPATPQYWAGSSLWMADHMCAIRFAREHDAKQAASAMLDGMNIRICEHVWSGDDIRESVSGENIRQSVSVSPREVALEKALLAIKELTKGPSPWSRTESRNNRVTIYGITIAALSPAQKGEPG